MIYRSTEHQLPMIPLGLRETRELEYKTAFKVIFDIFIHTVLILWKGEGQKFNLLSTS